MLCVIGSHAIHKQLKNNNHYYLDNYPKDMDVVGNYRDIIKFAKTNLKNINTIIPINNAKNVLIKGKCSKIAYSNIIEGEIIWNDTESLTDELFEIIINDDKTIFEGDLAYASLDVIYMLKMSHRYKKNSPHFLKTMEDILLLRKLGAKIPNKKFYKRRKKETYNYSHPKLNQDKNDFFKDDNIIYMYDHDDIHESVKIMDKPAYKYFKYSNEDVRCDMKKFSNLSNEIKINAVVEESMVLALERSIIPFNTDFKKAFEFALQKVCTSITSGKFREFAWENYYLALTIFEAYSFKINEFFHDIVKGKIKKIKG